MNQNDSRIIRADKGKYELRYDMLQVGDIIGTSNYSPFACGIRARTWGIDGIFNTHYCNHVGIVVKIGTKLFLLEAVKRVQFTSLRAYLNPNILNFGNRICFIGRVIGWDKKYEAMQDANDTMVDMAEKYLGYDVKGCIKMGLPLIGIEQDPNRFFCSELVAYVIQTTWQKFYYGLRIPDPLYDSGFMVTPEDFQRNTYNRINDIMYKL